MAKPQASTAIARLSAASPTVSTTTDSRADGGLLNQFEGALDDIRGLVACKICTRHMFEPYVTECGHSFCYSCLSQWFVNHRNNKTCPGCRAKVKREPVPDFTIRDIVQLFTNRAEMVEAGETTESLRRDQEEEANIIERDKANPDPRSGGLFKGCFSKFTRPAAIIDREDGVARCPRCAWELELGYCPHCHASFAIGDDMSDYSLPEDFDDSDEFDTEQSLDEFESAAEDEYGAFAGHGSDISLDRDGRSVHAHENSINGDYTIRPSAQGPPPHHHHDFANAVLRGGPRAGPRWPRPPLQPGALPNAGALNLPRPYRLPAHTPRRRRPADRHSPTDTVIRVRDVDRGRHYDSDASDDIGGNVNLMGHTSSEDDSDDDTDLSGFIDDSEAVHGGGAPSDVDGPSVIEIDGEDDDGSSHFETAPIELSDTNDEQPRYNGPPALSTSTSDSDSDSDESRLLPTRTRRSPCNHQVIDISSDDEIEEQRQSHLHHRRRALQRRGHRRQDTANDGGDERSDSTDSAGEVDFHSASTVTSIGPGPSTSSGSSHTAGSSGSSSLTSRSASAAGLSDRHNRCRKRRRLVEDDEDDEDDAGNQLSSPSSSGSSTSSQGMPPSNNSSSSSVVPTSSPPHRRARGRRVVKDDEDDHLDVNPWRDEGGWGALPHDDHL